MVDGVRDVMDGINVEAIRVVPITSVTPAAKPVPLTVSVCAEFGPVIGFGLRDVIVGGTTGAVT